MSNTEKRIKMAKYYISKAKNELKYAIDLDIVDTTGYLSKIEKTLIEIDQLSIMNV